LAKSMYFFIRTLPAGWSNSFVAYFTRITKSKYTVEW